MVKQIMARGNEFVHLFGDPDSLVRIDVSAFPLFIELQNLTFNKGRVQQLAEKTGIAAVSISAQKSKKPVKLAELLDPRFSKLFNTTARGIQPTMPEQANLILPLPIQGKVRGEPPIPAMGALLVVNSDSLELHVRADPIGRFHLRSASTWVPYLDRYLRQLFLTVGSQNLIAGIRRWGPTPESARLGTRFAKLRFDVNSGPLLSAAS